MSSQASPPVGIENKTTLLIEKAGNFAVAAAQHIAAGMPICTDEQVNNRYSICTACEFFAKNACTKCGCGISRDRAYVSKLHWADQSCPVGKWGPVG
jgi:hypothetical protein